MTVNRTAKATIIPANRSVLSAFPSNRQSCDICGILSKARIASMKKKMQNKTETELQIE